MNIFCDGFTDKNGQENAKASYGFVVKNGSNEIVDARHGTIPVKTGTNNIAEHAAFSDSLMAIQQMRGNWKARENKPYTSWFRKNLDLLHQSKSNIKFEWIPRELNEEADYYSSLSCKQVIEKHGKNRKRKN